MSAKDGGPAFAAGAYEHNSGGYLAWQDGMSLRDYFAAKAMQGLMASPECPESMEVAAKCSYNLADAMLKAREAL